MRTDVKVGLIIAAVLVAIGVGYLCFSKSPDNANHVADQAVTPPVPITHTPGDGSTGGDVVAAAPTDMDNPYSVQIADATTQPTTQPDRTTVAGIGSGSALAGIGDGAGSSALGPLPGTTTTDSVTGKKYYTVKAGDMGLAVISKIVYGDQKYYPDIKKANPSVDSTRLRPGMKLVIPDRQAPAASAARTGAITPTAIPAAGAARVASGSRTSAPVHAAASDTRTAHLRTGAPARTVLPGGAVFD